MALVDYAALHRSRSVPFFVAGDADMWIGCAALSPLGADSCHMFRLLTVLSLQTTK